MGVNMNTEENPNNLDCDKNTSSEKEHKTSDSSDFYIHDDGNLCYFPDEDKANKNNKSRTKNTDIMNTLETLLKKVDQLQRDVNQLMKKGTHTSEKNNDEILKALLLNLPNITSLEKNKNGISKDENLDGSSNDVFKEFVSIYNSQNVKKSISINKELEEKIKELVSKYYGIADNDSKIINTALMIALLKIH